jgi:hypothetical protein
VGAKAAGGALTFTNICIFEGCELCWNCWKAHTAVPLKRTPVGGTAAATNQRYLWVHRSLCHYMY